ncbi:MAG: hypothetical protein JWL67_1444 [Solirubrobacterales bacterium]|nr:hypothetical protein [Solirubrobacterales bacterium]
MATTTKAAKRKARPASRNPAARARKRVEENDRVIRRINKSLDVALADLTKVGAGAGDIRRDLTKLLRDARKHATKMGNATRKDLERLQKDVVAAAKSNAGRGAAKRSRSASSTKKSRAATSSSSRSSSSASRKTRAGGTTKKAGSTGTKKAGITRAKKAATRAAKKARPASAKGRSTKTKR